MSTAALRGSLKRLLPFWLQYPVYTYLWNPFRRRMWRTLDLQTTLRSGIHLCVLNHSDWVIYNEVIVNGEYDRVINRTLDAHALPVPLRVVDLGANVGYFSFRFLDLFLQRCGAAAEVEIALVEGSPAVFADLQHRVRNEPLVRDRAKLIHGLAGRRAGAAYIAQGYIHYGYGASPRRSWGAKRVKYVDMDGVFPGHPIDLLKCDIEGAEFDLIDNYPALLGRARAAVFEFHHYGRDISAARELLRRYGLSSVEQISAAPPCSVEFFCRES